MPFKESSRMEERIALLRAVESGVFSVSDLAASHGVSRETVYQWKRRRESGDERWFEEKSRAPLHCPHATAPAVIEAIVALRHRFERFGPKKLRARLMQDRPEVAWPAASTIGDILKRAGLIEPARRRSRPVDRGSVVAGSDQPNGEWAIDFKGWFRTVDGTRIDPLTVSDTASRYLLDVRVTAPTHEGVKAHLTRIFEEIGLPDAIRSDNGVPFGSPGAGGLSRLAVWLLKLDIEPRFIPPAAPQHNGRHERMHRTLKEDTAQTPSRDPAAQQARFDAFRQLYNEERPHEALGQVPPATRWTPPTRAMPEKLEEPWYDPNHEVRGVRTNGTIKWRGEPVFISEALAGETIGILEQEKGGHLVRFCHRDLGVIDRESRFHRFAPPRARLRYAVEPARQQT